MREEPTTEKQARAPPSLRARVVSRLITFAAAFTRPMTLGVRGLVIDQEGRVLLVRHTYVPGFYLPGGGVESGETLLAALERELHEEAGLRLVGPPTLHGVYLNRRASPRDHVALFVARAFEREPRTPDHEIAESGFFACDALPGGATPATRARIAEVVDGAEVSPYW